MIEAIAFDFGGTLFSTVKMGQFSQAMESTFVQAIAQNFSQSHECATAVFQNYVHLWKKRRERAQDLPEVEISSAHLLEGALVAAGIQPEPSAISKVLDQFHAEESTSFVPLDGVATTLPALSKAFRLFIVSNNPWSEAIRASLRRHKLELFEKIIVSCDVGYRKPSAHIFSHLLQETGVSGQKFLFVGDSFEHDILTPKNMGFKTCLVDFEGKNKSRQRDYADRADFFLTRFFDLTAVTTPLRK